MTKRFLSVLLCAVMLLVLLPTAAFAMDYSVTGDKDLHDVFFGVLNGNDTLTIAAGATLTINAPDDLLSVERGAEVINNGTIINNGTLSNVGAITNDGVITNNGWFTNDGTITNNNDTVTINGNTGTVTNNFGTVDGNAGTVTNNFDTVTNTSTGTVTNNFGTVINTGGTVTNNFGGRVDSGFVENYYYQVTVTNGDHTTNTLTVENNQLWLLSGGSATFTPQPGYVITNAVSDNLKAAFTSSNGVWTLTDDGTNTAATAVTLTVEELPASSVPHTGSDRQTELMVTLALISGAVLLSGIISRKKRA